MYILHFASGLDFEELEAFFTALGDSEEHRSGFLRSATNWNIVFTGVMK